MASKNITKKIAALAELRKDPAAAIDRAWKSIRDDHDTASRTAHESDVDLIEQVLGAVIADIRADAKKESDA